jgi:copper(I)-binding protein
MITTSLENLRARTPFIRVAASRVVAGGALLTAALLTSACTSSDQHTEAMAQEVTMTNQWASAADSGMTAVFGTFANAGHHDARIVGGESAVAGHVEVHEVVPDAAGSKTMRPMDGGLNVPAGQARELRPGGDHLMLMDLKQPLRPGDDVPVIVLFDDGSTLPVTAQVRDFAGGNEEYTPAGGTEARHDHG